MPMKPITIKANFQLDTSAARAQLQGLQKELSSVTKGATVDLGITSEITKAVKEAQLLKQTLAEATDFRTGAFDLSKFDAALKQQNMSIQQFKQSLQTLGPEGEKAFNSLATTIASAQVPLKRTSQGVQELMTAFGNTMRWQATSMAMHKVVGTIQQAFNYAQNLDKSLTNISIVTGHNADYMRNFAKEANKAAQALSASTLEYTNASLIYYQQGLGDKEVAKRAETTLKLAKVTGESASKVSQQMTAVWNNFSNGVDNLERYADVMTALGATTASSSSEIAKGLEKFASVTKTIGLSYDYAASALATVTAQTRQSADSVGTAFKTLFSRLESLNLGETLDDSTTLNKYSEALLKAGVNIMDVNGHLKDMDTILDELGAQWNNLNKAQQVALSQTVGGVRNYTSLITLMDNWEDFQNNVVTSQLAEGTLQKQADIYAQSWEAAQQRVKTASQGIYDTLISSDFFKGFNNAIAGLLNNVNNVGQTLGTKGSLAGIFNLILGTNGERIAKGIDNTIVNTLGQTNIGQEIFRKQQQALAAEFTKNMYDTGTEAAVQRSEAYNALIKQWDEYRSTTYKNKQQAQIGQAIMQVRNDQVLDFMNNTINTEKTGVQNSIKQYDLSTMLAGYGLGANQNKPGIGNASAVQQQFLNPLLGGGGGQYGAYAIGASEYLKDAFIQPLKELAGMNLTPGASTQAENLAKYIQASATNAWESEKLQALFTSDPNLQKAILDLKTSPLQLLMNGGKINEIIDNFAKFDVNQITARANAIQKLNDAFIQANPDAIKYEKDGVTPSVDSQGRAIIDYDSEKGKAYLESLKDAESVAKDFQKKELIDEHQLKNIQAGLLKDGLKPEELQRTSFGTATVQVAQMASSIAMATSSVQNFSKQVQEGTATTAGLISTLGTTGMAFGQMAGVWKNVQKIGNSNLSVRGLGLIGAGITAAALVGTEIYQRYQARTVESKSEYANENRIALNAQAKEDQQKYEQFLPVMQEQQQALEKVLSFQQGTKEYTAALISNNNAARELIETYDLQANKDYSINNNGAISFSAEQIKSINEQLLEASERSNTLSQVGLSVSSQLGYTVSSNQLQKQEDFITTAAKTRGAAAEIEEINQTAGMQGSQFAGFSAQVHAMQTAEAEYNQEELEKLEKINEKRTQLRENALGDYETVLNSVITSSSYEGDKDKAKLAAILLSLDSKNLEDYSTRLEEEVFKFGQDGGTRTEKGAVISDIDKLSELYFETFGTIADANMSAQSIAAAIESQRAFEILEDQLNQFGNNLDSQYISDFVNINNKSYKDMFDLFDKIQNTVSGDNLEAYNTFIQKALTDSVKAQDDLVQAMMANSQFNGQEYIKIAQQLQEGAANFSTQQLETLTNYVNSFTNNFGEEAGKAVFDALTNNQQGWNQNYYEALQKISLDNSISALADLTQFNNQRINADLVEPLGKLRSAIIEDVESRGGLAKTLFTSSEFTKVFDSLSEQYKVTGEITSQNIADLAKKNDIIGDYMTVSGANEQAIADLFEIVASGDLSVENITPAIEHFVQRASGAEGAQQEALDVVAEQDLSDSITNMDKWAQNIGKAWYTGRTNDVLGDRPVLEGLKMVLTPEDYADFLRTLAIGEHGGTTSSMITSMKGNMANAYAMLTKLEGSGKKKGKGGGGMDTVYEYLAKEGVFDESGIQYDTKTHNFIIGGDKFADRYALGDDNRLVTFSGLKDYIIESLVGSGYNRDDSSAGYGFKGKGYTREQAEDLATMMLGSMSASSMGMYLTAEGLIDAANTFFGELKGEGQQQGNYITPEQYEALFNQYSDILATMKMEQVTNEKTGKTEWKLSEASAEEMKKEGFIGVSPEQWRQYFVQEAKKAGSAIIGIKGSTQLGKQDAKAIGEAIAGASQGTIKATSKESTDAIVQAAVAAGVQKYQDFQWQYGSLGPERKDKGQSLDYDQLQNFYNNVLGLSTDILNAHLETISKDNEGLAFTHKWTDAYGVEHNINSRDYENTGEFTRAIEQENDFSDMVLQYQRDQWISNYWTNPDLHGPEGPTYEGAMRYLREMTDLEAAKAQSEASSTTESEPINPENPPKGNEEGASSEGEGETNANATSVTGVTTTPEGAYKAVDTGAQKKVGKYSDYTYRGNAEAEKIYRYNLLHPNLTPAEAYDKVHSGKVDVDAEWNKKYPPKENLSRNAYLTEEQETQAEIAKRQAMLAAKDSSAYWTSLPPEGGTEGTVTPVDRTLRRRTKDSSAYWTNQPPEGGTEGTVIPITAEERETWHMQGIVTRLAENMTTAGRDSSAYWTNQPPEGGTEGTVIPVDRTLRRRTKDSSAYWTNLPSEGGIEGTVIPITAEEREIWHMQGIATRLAENMTTAGRDSSAYWTVNAPEIYGPENPELEIWKRRQQLEKEAREAVAKEAEEAAAKEAEEAVAKEVEPEISKEAQKWIEDMGITEDNIDLNKDADAIINALNNSDLTDPQRQEVLQAVGLANKTLKDISETNTDIADSTAKTADVKEEKEEKENQAKVTGQKEEEKKEEEDKLDLPPEPTPAPPSGDGGVPDSNDGGIWGPSQGGNTNQITGTDIGKGIWQGVVESVAGWIGGAVSALSGRGKGDASGQNNARLLAYASGKEGHIAVTGELGPELRVKSDGSMDILGKTGREYAWVEPDDKIYTASQSAGILKSNKIPGLEGLAKGINNYIPGYSVGDVRNNPITTDKGHSGSSGGGRTMDKGSRGGSAAAVNPLEEEKKDPRYDPNTLKIRDILERYYTILQKIDDITRAVEKFAKVADRAWGQDRIKAIEKQTALFQQQYDAQKKYVQEIGEYMNTDSMALTTMIREFVDSYNEGKEEADKITWTGAQFDSNGVLTNYREFVEKLVEKYNANLGANAQVRGQGKEAQYKFQEQLKDIQMYTDTLNLWESETDKLQELANQILDNSLKEITYRVEYELELNADQKRLLDFHDSFVKDDMFRIAEHISNINEEIANTVDNLEKTREGIYDYFGTLAGENMRVGAFYDDVALGLATRDEKGVMNAKSYEDVNFAEVSENLDKWLAELREKDKKSAEEVDKIIKRNEEGLIINYRDTLNKINEMNQQLSNDSISLLLTDVETFFNQISDLTNNPQWTGLSTEMKDQITNYMDQMIQYIQAMGDQFKEIIESMGDSIKAFGKKMDAEVDEFDYYGDVYKSFGNIIDLTNQHMTDITSDFFKTLNNKALDNNINKIEAARRRYELFSETLRDVQGQYNAMLDRLNSAQGAEEKAFYQQRVDELKEQLDIANSQMENAHKDFLQSWEDALSKIQESYKSAVEQASKDFEKSFSPLFNTLALLQAQFDREKALGDLYVDNYQRIHDLNKLDRDIQNSIDDTDNLRGKQRLRDLQAEINQLQEDGNDLSEYDLDILDKKYKLELARQALEDAKDAKSMVRLARDNNGNWSYVYTANQDDVDKAEQNYEDAIREMEQANEDYIKNIQDQIVQVQQEAQQAILALQPEDFATYDDYLMAVQNIQNSMYQTLDYLRSQMDNAFGNNQWLENYIPNIIQDHGLTDDFGDTILSNLLANDNLNSAIQNAKNNFENNLITPALEAFTLYSEKQKEVYIAAGKDIATIGQSFGEEMDQLTEKSGEQVKVVMDLADRVETTFGDAMVEVIDATNDWLDKIKDVVAEYDILLAQITELKKIDGKYVEPAKMINGDNAIDDWAEIDRFKRELRDNGILNVITTDTETGKEKSTQYIAADTENINAFLKDASIAAAKKDIDQFDLGDDGVDDAENSKVKAYLAQHGYVWIKYKGEELMFSSEEEWNAWYEKHKPAPPAASEPDGWWRNPYIVGGFTKDELAHWGGLDTGGYTGRWQSADTGMYTGEWPSGSVRRNGRLAWLHQKELVLNAHDTENFLDAMQIVRQLDNLTNWMANGLGDLIMPNVSSEMGELEQNVHIEAEFPNVTDHNEIEQAFNNLVNMASQYANRK